MSYVIEELWIRIKELESRLKALEDEVGKLKKFLKYGRC